MKKIIIGMLVGSCFFGAMSVFATNGDNLIGVGPVSRGMGGVGIAEPQDSVTAVFNNPAALGACPCVEKSESVFGGTIFDPSVSARITMPTPQGPLEYSGDSEGQPFIIPAVGGTMKLNDDWWLGIGAYGISGMGVDYRDKGWDLDGDPSNGYEGDIYTKLEIMKFAGVVSYQALNNLSVGAALNASYNSLDLGQGDSHDYAFGGQLGALLDVGGVKFGASYTSPQKANFRNVYNFDAQLGDDQQDDLTLEAPAVYGIGAAATPADAILLEVDAKYIDWNNADGYKDFDWESQWVFGVGAQLNATEKLALRCGFNYGKSPVKEHNGWDPMGMTTIQGKQTSTFGYEMLRTVGFPAVVESHATVGLSYRIVENMSLHLAYMHGFENSISETSAGEPMGIELKGDLSEDTYSFALAWNF